MSYLELGNRIPSKYFITSGKGESNVGCIGLPYETGSYDAALTDAGIEYANIIQYTSVMPTDAKEISKKQGIKNLKWGEVIECIIAIRNGNKGETITTMIITVDVKNHKNKYLGGFALEFAGGGNRKMAEESLLESVLGIIKRRNYGTVNKKLEMYKDNKTTKGYTIYPGKVAIFKTMNVKENYGTVISSICFTQYKYPIIHNKTLLNKPKTRTRKTRTRKTRTRKTRNN